MPPPFSVLSFFLVVVALAIASPGHATPWRSELYPEHGDDATTADLYTDKVLQDFSYAGYRRGEVPIPDVAGPVFDVTAAPYSADPTGAVDATDAIQAAIDHAGASGGGVVFLPAGTYRLSVPADRKEALSMDHSRVVLRGAGRELTRLLNTTYVMRGKAVIRLRGPTGAGLHSDGSHQVVLSADVMTSTRVIPVVSTAGFSVGNTVVVRNTVGDDWMGEHAESGWLGRGAVFGGLTYRRTVLAVDRRAHTLTLDAPVRYALKTRDQARVVRLASAPLSEAGLEDFSIGNVQHPGSQWGENEYRNKDTAAHDVHGTVFIVVERARDVWLRRLASFQPPENTSTAHLLSGAVAVVHSTHVTLAECSFQRTQYGGGGGNGYLYRLSNSGECLIRDSEARFSRHGFVILGMGASGNVIHASIDADSGRSTGSTGSYATVGFGSDHHMHFSQATLIDQCTGEDSWWEARYRPFGSIPRHNLTATHSVFWNTRGTGTRGGPIVHSEQARYGYIIGTSGPRSAVARPRIAAAGTDPVDHLEGEGRGESLVPQSLYLDQHARRLGSEAVRFFPPDTTETDIVPKRLPRRPRH